LRSPQPRKTVFLITDTEGAAGVCRQDQTDPKDQEMRQLLTGEVNSAAEGFYEGGADEVIVWDGHDGSQALSALTIHPRAKLLMGHPAVTITFETPLRRDRLRRAARRGQHQRRCHGPQLQFA
jgi:D-amino peptidase